MGIETEVLTTVSSGIASLQPVLDRYGLWALFVACLVEGFGIPLPGQTLLIACALLAATGKLNLAAVLLVAWLATQLGDIIGYLLGRYGLQGLLKRALKHRDRLLKAEAAFARWGIGLLLVARFLDGLRQTSNMAAGALLMPWGRFLVGTIAGTTLWVGTFGFGAYTLERDFHRITDLLEPLGPYALTSTILLLLFFLLSRRPSSR
ncbi:MAG: DedA family protein [Thiocapsa sp.]|jgi:membrane protein DedA with SNARE-associated domain|nr:DedA family protein [Thiocapsa sp.]MCG6897265.1 DedA family protein [Thiocapsa sp.]MCG6985421.1 DedA family protein [Thiocapsa sp.]